MSRPALQPLDPHPVGDDFQRRIVGSYGRELDAPVHSVLGLGALLRTMQDAGVGLDALCAGTGVSPQALSDPEARMSQRQKISLFANVQRLSPDPGVGLRAGQRQRMSDFAVFGYAMASSATFADAVRFGIEHVRLAGPVLEKSFRVEGGQAIFEGHDAVDLGPLLPLVTEFWFSSTQALMSRVLERPFPSHRLLLPYAAPPHAALYEQVLGCPVSFDTGVMQWHFDAALLAEPLPNANPIAAKVCAEFCGRMLESFDGESPLVKTIRQACLNSAGGFPGVDEMAARLHLSPRTLHRRLAEAGTGYQDILDELRRRLAIEFLQRTGLSIDQIAYRSGFSDVSNFRKAFKKWTGQSPAHFRSRKQQPAGAE
jgi:AraC-like DNA-binding protein